MNSKMLALVLMVLLLSANLTVSAAPPDQSTAAKQQIRAQSLTATLETAKPSQLGKVAPPSPSLSNAMAAPGTRGENDLCENATPVGPPYPVTVSGPNEGATIDCPGLLDWYSTWWAIELPYAENNLFIDFCETPFEITNVGIVIMNDCACDDYVAYNGIDWYGCPSGLTSPTIWWNGIAGPSTWLFPVYFDEGALQPYTLTINVEEVVECVIECEEGDTIEGEPICEDNYEDTYNGGCNSSPFVFQPIALGETICGTSGTFYFAGSSYRDTDWFEIELTTPMSVSWTVEAEFEVLIFIMNGGSGNCIDYAIISNAIGPACTPVSLTEALAPGLYWFWVGPTVFGTGVPCGSTYRATLSVTAGACCDDDTGDCEDGVPIDQCLPPLRFAANTACEDLSPACGVCPEAMIYIEIMTDNWPSETTWEVTVHDTGEVVGSGGPYTLPGTLYTDGVCVPYDSCHDFTIYDSYADGIVAPGGYAVSYEGQLIYSCIGYGWSGPDETVELIGEGCVWPPGACCIEVGGDWECLETNTEPECDDLGGWFYEGETCPEFECPGCTDEGEPICYDDYEDTYNGGCNSTPFIFQPITCGETICGTSGTFYFNGNICRDTDWFEIELQAATNVIWAVCAEFEVLIFIIDGGTGNCVDYAFLGSAVGAPYQETSLSFDVGPGLYWFWIGPSDWGPYPCGVEYVATLTVDPNVCCVADVDGDGDTDLTDLAILLSAYGSVPGDPNWNPVCDFDADNDVDLTDLAFLLTDYGCGG